MNYAIYRLYDTDGDLLYIGQTSNFLGRINVHLRAGYAGQVARIEVQHLPAHSTRDDAEAAERVAIIADQPRWNVQHRLGTFGPPVPFDPIPDGIATTTLAEAARRLDCRNQSVVARVCVHGRARYWRTGEGVRIAVDDLERLLADTTPTNA